jgi:hypothetical protein
MRLRDGWGAQTMAQHTREAAASLEAYRAKTAINLNAEKAGEILRGRIAANMTALSCFEGHMAALAYVNELLKSGVVPSDKPKLELVVSNSAEVVK